jgi:mRNA interferase HigB
MRVIAKRTLREFWEKHPDTENPLKEWHQEAVRAQWATPHVIKAQFRSASILKNGRVVFNIAGNKYRLVAAVTYRYQTLWVRFIGSHEEYDKIDAEVV